MGKLPKRIKFFSINEAANYLGVSTKTLRRWEASGVLKALRTSGGHRRYSIEDLTEIRKSKKVNRNKVFAKDIAYSPVVKENIAPEIKNDEVLVNTYNTQSLEIYKPIELHPSQRQALKNMSIAFASFLFLILTAKVSAPLLASYSQVKNDVIAMLPVHGIASSLTKSYKETFPTYIAQTNSESKYSQVLAATAAANTPVFNVNIQSSFHEIADFVKGLTSLDVNTGTLEATGAATFGTTVDVVGDATFGNITKINGLTYSFPAIQGTSGTVLKNDGNGTLSWGNITVPTSLTDLSGVLPISKGGTNNSNAYTSGSIIFSDGTKLTESNTNLFWDNTNKRLGLGTATPKEVLDVEGALYIADATAPTTTTNRLYSTAGTLYWGPDSVCTSGDSCSSTGTLTGTGTANTIAKFTGASTLANSLLTDNGSSLGYNSNFTVTSAGAGTFASTLTASNGLTLTTGALNLTSTSGTSNLTSTATSGTSFAFTNNSFTADNSNLSLLTFKNANTGAGTTTNGINVAATGNTPSSGTNTENLINLSATASGGNTFNGINFGSGLSNYINGTNFSVTSAGAETLGSSLTSVGVNSQSGLIQGTGGITVTGTANINATGTANTAIGNASGTFTLTSTGLNVTTGGALTGVASIDTITTSATALTFAANGTIDSGAAGTLNLGTTNASNINISKSGSTTTVAGTVSLTGLASGSGNGVCLDGSNNLVTCTVGTGGISGSGTSGQIAFFNGANSITSESTGFSWNTSTKKLGLGIDSPDAKLQVTGAVTGKALVIFDETGDQNILTASASGVTKLNVTRTGFLNVAASGGIDTLAAGTLNIGTTTANAITIGQTGVTTTNAGSLTSTQTLTASNGLTLTTGALNLTSTSGTTNLTSAVNTGSSYLFNFQNSNTGAGTTANGVSVAATGSTPSSGTNTNNLINLSATALGGNTFNGITFGSGLSNYINGTNFTVTSAGAETLGSSLTAVGVDAGIGLLQGTGGITVTGTTNINATGTANTAIGNATGTFALVSNGGLNVTTGGALTGVASIDTISVSATALTFAGAGTISSTGTNPITIDSGTTGIVNIGTGASGKTINIGTSNSLADTINIASALDTTTVAGTVKLTNLSSGTGSAVCLDGSSNLITCTVGSGGVAGSGTAGQIAYFDGTSSITSEASGFKWDAANNLLGLGTDSPASKLHVSGAVTGKALVTFDETGDQNILTASASGVTKLNVTRTGFLNVAASGGIDTLAAGTLNIGTTTANAISIGNSGATTTLNGPVAIALGSDATGDIYYRNSGGTLSRLGIGTTAQMLTVSVGGLPSWTGGSGTGDAGFWTRTGTTLSPYNVGDNITTSGNITTTGSGVITSAGLLTGSAGLTVTGGTANINVAGTSNTAIGNATGTFALVSNGGLNVTTGGALTGVASLDTITTTSTALTFAGAGTVDVTAAALNLGTSGATSVSLGKSGITTTNNGALTSSELLTASNGLTLTTGALNLTSTSGTSSLTSTAVSGTAFGFTDASFTTTGAKLSSFAFTNTAAAGSVTNTGLAVVATGTASSGANTNNLIDLSATASAGNNTFNGINFGSNLTNYINGTNFTVTAAGAETIGSTLTVQGTSISIGNGSASTISTPSGNAGITIAPNGSGALNLATTNTGAVNIGNGTGAVSLTLGSDATGDIYYRNSGGTLSRLGVQADGKILTLASGLPSWADATGTFTSFNIAGDTGSDTVSNSQTVTVAGGTNGIDTVESGRTVTLNLDTTEIGSTTFGSGAGLTYTFDASAGTDTTIAFGDNTQTFTTGAASFTGTLTSSSTLTASNGLTLTTGALNLTSTSGTSSLTSTAVSGTAFGFTDASFTTTGAKLSSFAFTNTAASGSVTNTGLAVVATGTASSGTNTNNLIDLSATASAANNTFNGINFGSNLTNYINSTNFTVTAAGAETIGSNLTVNGTTITFAGAGSVAAGGSSNLALDAGTSGQVNIAGVSTGDVNLAGGSAGTGCTVTNSNGDLTCSGNITGGTTGSIGYWTRSGTTLSPATTNDIASIGSNSATALLTLSPNGATGVGLAIGALTGATANTGISIGAITAAATANNFGINIGAITPQASATAYSINTTGIAAGAGTATYGINIGTNASTATTNYGIKIGAISGVGTTNYGEYIDNLSGGTTSKGLFIGTNSSATATGIDIGALSGGTANLGLTIGGISGGGTASAINTGTISSTGATAQQINLGTITGANATSHAALAAGNISGTTAAAYGINLGTLTGGTTSNYQIQTGNITSVASATNAGLVIGTTKATTGTAASSTNYGININPLDSTGTSNTGINIGAISGASALRGIQVGAITAAATANNFSIDLGAITPQASATVASLNTAGIAAGAGTATYGINLGTNASTATTNYGLNIGAITGVGTTNTAINIGAVTGSSTNNYIVAPNFSITAAGLGTFADDVAVNGGDITTTQTTATLFNATATTLSMGGAATTALNLGNGAGNYTAINLGSGAGTHTINIAGTGATAADTINIGTGGTGADTINIGSSASTTAINLTSGTGSQTFASSVATGTTTSGAFVFTANALTTGAGMYVNSSSITTGDLVLINSSGTTLTSGNLFNVQNNSSSVFSVSGTAVTSALPFNETAAGDVSIAYDIQFTNPTASYIKSAAPLYLAAGETFNSSNLNLKTYNFGSIVLDSVLSSGTGTKYTTYINAGDSTAIANTSYALYATSALTGNAAKVGVGLYSTVTTSSTTSDTIIAADLATSATGIIGATTRNNYGLRTQPASTGANTAGTQNLYGIYSAPSGTLANGSTENVYGGYFGGTATVAAGTINRYGLYVANDTMNTTGTSTQYGLAFEPVTGADTNVGICFDCDGTFGTSTVATGIQWGGGAETNTQQLRLFRSNGAAAAQFTIEDGAGTDIMNGSATTVQINLSAQIGATAQRLCHGGADAATDLQTIGDCNATNADLAEYYGVLDDAQPGEIITLSGEATESAFYGGKTTLASVVKSSDKYQKSVIGVVSTNPSGEVLGEAGKPYLTNPKPIALIGRTPIKVSTENGNIAPGDFITSSSIPGVGMKATEPGMIVAQALSSYTNSDPTAIGSMIAFIRPFYYYGINLADNAFTNNNSTPSAELALFNSIFTASSSGVIANVHELDTTKLNVLGDAVLGDTVINGKLNIGSLTFDNTNQSINAIGVLKIQDLALGNVEFMNGLITFDTNGNIIAKSITADKYKVAGTSAGTGVITAGQTSVIINTNQVTSDSLIFVTAETATSKTLSVTDKITNTSFKVEIASPETKDIKFSWWIVDKQ